MPGFNIDWPVELMYQVSFLTMHGWVYDTRYTPWSPGQDDSKTDPLGEGWYKEGHSCIARHLYNETKTICFSSTSDAYYAELQAIEDAKPKPEKKT